MFETIIVAGILILALFFVGRSAHRAVTGRTGGCRCSSNCTALASRNSLETPDNHILNKRR